MMFSELLIKKIWDRSVSSVKLIAYYPDGTKKEYPIKSKDNYLVDVPIEIKSPKLKDVIVGYYKDLATISGTVTEDEIWVLSRDIRVDDINNRVATVVCRYDTLKGK